MWGCSFLPRQALWIWIVGGARWMAVLAPSKNYGGIQVEHDKSKRPFAKPFPPSLPLHPSLPLSLSLIVVPLCLSLSQRWQGDTGPTAIRTLGKALCTAPILLIRLQWESYRKHPRKESLIGGSYMKPTSSKQACANICSPHPTLRNKQAAQ